METKSNEEVLRDLIDLKNHLMSNGDSQSVLDYVADKKPAKPEKVRRTINFNGRTFSAVTI